MRPQVWDVAARQCLATFGDHEDSVCALAALGDSALASGSFGLTVQIHFRA